MKQKSLWMILLLVLCLVFPIMNQTAASPTSTISETSCVVDTPNTQGVTFTVTDIVHKDGVLIFTVLQQPNDDDTSLVDNQVDFGVDTVQTDRTIAEAKPYGTRLLGTLCDIASLTDQAGNDLIKEYMIGVDREKSSLITTFSVYDLPANTDINLQLVFGVNEDLQNQFDYKQTLDLTFTTLTWEACAKQMHINEHAMGRYENWAIKPKQDLVQDLLSMGYITPSQATTQLFDPSVSESEKHTLADQILLGCIDHLPAVANDPTTWWVEWSVLTDAFWGDSRAWTPAQKAWHQENTNLYRITVEKDVFVAPNEFDLPEKVAVAISSEALKYAYAPLEVDMGKFSRSMTLYVTDHATHASPDYRRWDVHYYSDELNVHVIVDQNGRVIQDFEMDTPSLEDYALAQKTKVDETTPSLIAQYAEMAMDTSIYQIWQWSIEDKAAWTQKSAPLKEDQASFINPTQSDQPIEELLLGTTFVYGLPSHTQLQEEPALVLAKQCMQDFYKIPQDALDDFLSFGSFDVTDPDNPLWKFVFTPYALTQPNDDRLYKIELSAQTGEIVQKHRLYWDKLFQNSDYDLRLY